MSQVGLLLDKPVIVKVYWIQQVYKLKLCSYDIRYYTLQEVFTCPQLKDTGWKPRNYVTLLISMHVFQFCTIYFKIIWK